MLPFRIAIRFLISGKTQTILIIAGMAVAISIQIFVGLLINSLQISLVDSTIGSSPHITITSTNDVGTIRAYQDIIDEIEKEHLTTIITPVATGNAFVQEQEKEYPVLIRGLELDEAEGIYHFINAIYEGSPFRSSNEVLMGKELRNELDIHIGDKIHISTPDGTSRTFTVSGFYDLGIASINKSWLISDFKTAQQLFKLGNRVTSIEMTIPDPFAADLTSSYIDGALEEKDIKIENWKDQNRELLRGLEGQRNSSDIIQIVIVISVVIAISSVLVISVLQKQRQIGILKAMGIKDFDASMIFIYQGFLLGLIGSVIGIFLGLGLLFAFNYFTTTPDGSTVVDLYIEYGFIIRSWLIALLASTIAGIIPARKSLRLDPIEVIREG
jgi:lipoprotein-releasing system permease protein